MHNFFPQQKIIIINVLNHEIWVEITNDIFELDRFFMDSHISFTNYANEKCAF